MLLSRVCFMMFLGEMQSGNQEIHSLLIIINGQRHLEEIHDAVIYDLNEERIIDISNLNLLKRSQNQWDFLTRSPSFSMKGHFFKNQNDGHGSIIVLAPSKNHTRFSVFLHAFGQETMLNTCSGTTSDWCVWQELDEAKLEENKEPHPYSSIMPSMRYAFNLAGDNEGVCASFLSSDTLALWRHRCIRNYKRRAGRRN